MMMWYTHKNKKQTHLRLGFYMFFTCFATQYFDLFWWTGAIFGPKKSPVSPFRPAAEACPPCRAAFRPLVAPQTPLATQRAVAPPAAPPGVRPPCLGSVGANCQQRSSGEWRHHLAEGMVFNMFPLFFFSRNPGNSIVGALPSAESFSFRGFIYCRWNPPPKKKTKNG